MAFKLLIECSKDIDKLSIDFSDGTSVIQESPDNSEIEKHQETKSPTRTSPNRKKNTSSRNPDKPKMHNNQDTFLDLDAYDDVPVQSDVVQKPVIDDKERDVKVAEELQNLDI